MCPKRRFTFTDTVHVRTGPRHQRHQNWLRVPTMDALCAHHVHDLIHHTLRQLLHESILG